MKNNFCLPSNYTRRLNPAFYDDTHNTDKYQRGVYALASSYHPLAVLDIGCGSAYKLLHMFPSATILTGLDLPPTVAWLRRTYPGNDWRVADFTVPLGRQYHLVLLADILEHLGNPIVAITFALNHMLPNSTLIISTPARDYLPAAYSTPSGPPRNPSHAQEWSFAEFVCFVEQFTPTVFAAVVPHHTTVIICQPS